MKTAMESSVCLNYSMIATINHQSSLHKLRKYKLTSTNPIRIRSRRRFNDYVIKNFKQHDFQDFNGYAKPSRLLEATEVKVCMETLPEKDFPTFSVGKSRSLFKVKLQTSNAYGSSLSDQNTGILLCLIDANGESILQRIPVILQSISAETLDVAECNSVHFQRGSVDEFTFEGPKLERIEALWVSIESGQWRLGGVNLTVITDCPPPSEGNDEEKIQFTVFHYEFQVDDILLGDGSDISMVELRPSLVSELSTMDPYNLLSKTPSKSTSTSGSVISNKESMREYADLKLSLLSYDATLIFVGTIVANFSAGENSAFAFFIGGLFGFSYLLLLQRSVDGLPASTSVSSNTERIDQLIRGFKGPVTGLALAIGFTSLAVKYSSGDFSMVLTAKELLIGTMGFLACKVAVVLAAFKPMSMGLKENE